LVIDRNELLTGVGIGRGNLFRLEMPVAVSASEFIFGGDRVARPAKRGQRPLWNLRSKLVSSLILLVSTNKISPPSLDGGDDLLIIDRNELLTGVGIGRGNLFRLLMSGTGIG